MAGFMPVLHAKAIDVRRLAIHATTTAGGALVLSQVSVVKQNGISQRNR